MFDFFKNIFDNLFGSGDSDNDADNSPWGGEEDDSFGWGGDVSDITSFEELGDIEERIIESGVGDGEFVQEFYDVNALMEYLEGTPESVLKFIIDPDQEVYYVYRYNSE